MKKTNIKLISRRIICGALAFALFAAYFPNIASASQIGARKVLIGSSIASESTTYRFTMTVPSATVIKSASFAACTTASGACTPAPGFSSSASTLTQQPTNMGDAAGWTVNTAVAGQLRLLNNTNATARTGSQDVYFSGVVNPSATNTTFFIRMTTYSDAAWTTPIDTGVVASSVTGASPVTVTASVDETLTFTLGTATVALGTLTSATTGKGTSAMSVATNAPTGYSIAYTPTTTLTSGTNTIAALAGGASALNTPQFGINLMSNTTPAVGTNVSGAGTGAASTGYNTANSFKFNTAGDTVAQVAVPTNSNTFTTSYIANVSDITAAGAYSTAITYVATANF